MCVLNMELGIILERKPRMTVSKRLIISSMVLVISILGLTTVLIITLVNRQFNQYVTSDFLAGMDIIREDVSQALIEDEVDQIEKIGSSAVVDGYFVEIVSENGDVYYVSPNIASTNMMGRNVSLLQMENMPMYSGIKVKSWVIESSESSYLLNIGYIAGDGLSEDARRFKNSVYLGIILALIIGIGLSYIGSRLLAKPLRDDMKELQEGVAKIQTGELHHRFDTDSSVSEIEELKESINKMASNLLNQEEMRKDLVATVSHEVKTPLTVLKSQIDAFIDGTFSPSTERLNKCKDEIVSLERLMESMDNFNEFSASNYLLSQSVFSIKEELEALSIILKPQFDRKALTMKVSIEEDVNIKTDRYKLRQVIYNLLSNAYKFSFEGTVVDVAGTLDSEDLILEVRNQGLIIKEKDQVSIFQPRYRAADADSKDPHGKGLGLHISRTLLEALGGRIELIQSSEDETVFRVVLNHVRVQDA